MESFFFNITDTQYQYTHLYQQDNSTITRVDISNGIVFFDIQLCNHEQLFFPIKNLDRMIVFSAIIHGHFSIHDNISSKEYQCKTDDMSIFSSSKQDFSLTIPSNKTTNIFILFVADFFFKRYLSAQTNEPIDFLYNQTQSNTPLQLIKTQTIDAMSLYTIKKIRNINQLNSMKSILGEHSVIEYMLHQLSLLDFYDETLDKEELRIVKKAKEILLKNFVNAPTIQALAHSCATNETKLKLAFKKVNQTTIYQYIQKLRLEKANLLLKEQVLNIGEIAKDVGYKHQGHFSKLFFETYGVYPKDLLKGTHKN